MKFKSIFSIFLFLLFNTMNLSAQVPAIKLKSATDNSTFDLKKEKGKFVALHFLLKTECPFCIKHTQDYFTKAKTLPNVKQVFIKPDSELEILSWAKKLSPGDQAQFPIYRDPEAKLAELLKIPNGYRFHGQVVHYPATILIDPKGKEVYRYVGKNNTDRLSFEALTAKVKEFSK
ncbi:peroxiredoxin family protein [Daejeonella lutea]|uniref:Peroxiredoxin Q/BCP n=1 Tax=Daejeonella lutea TaxID=572036 RepID=A0A1T5DBN6_9SPHI|nr:redoxin family protein [Daejeonella lutea]SKB69099.1 peroxiredoxin Q/BCP [Daejeonella lutea]